MEDIQVSFPGGKRVDARVSCGGSAIVVRTDQPLDHGGQGTAVAPFDLFLASLATCGGYYVLAFCQARGVPTQGITLRQHTDIDATTHLPSRIRIEVGLPPSFPEKYRTAVVRAAEGCKVKKTMAAMPSVEVTSAAAQLSLQPVNER